jgi:hypothetical protein
MLCVKSWVTFSDMHLMDLVQVNKITYEFVNEC